ncbi:unnamed protein product [Lymnaea stagnalis]|uniref:RRM domain-containing protein n=1 Tax=Lymnaea stagnalis TaxID=6523 RepID=A0AAV2I8G6_LYMST
MAEETHEEKHGKTIFIRNLPYSTNNEKLEKIFSDIGPIKSCFVVSDKDSGKCRGFGYVKYTLLEDAEKALKTIKKVEGRNVHIMYAKKKEKKKKFGRPVKEPGDDQTTETTNEGKAQKNVPETKAPVTKGQAQEKKTASFNKFKQPKAEPPVKGLRQAPNPLNEGKRARLIVRNLSFKCEKEDLKKAFGNFGTVVDVHIPKKASGLKMGFGFVQFANKAQAGMAVKELNGKEISGRVVAVDWSLPKDKFEATRTVNKMEIPEESTEDVDNSVSMDVDEDDESIEEDAQVDRKSISATKKGNAVTNKGNVTTQKGKAVKESSEEDESSSDEGEEESESSEDEQDWSDEEESIGGDDEDTSEDDEEDSGSEDEDSHGKPAKTIERPSDVNEGRTLFIRNMPFNTEEEDLYEFFSQFGDVKYCKIVMDFLSGMPKGSSAFVQFLSKESADACHKAATESENRLTIGGRQIVVEKAISRQRAEELLKSKEKKKEQKDTRNLYLAREGVIREGTEAAKDVPPADLALRAKISAANRQKLKDQNIFVSSTRLCVHNIPPTVVDQRLRQIVYQAAGDKSAKSHIPLLQCRIMRDLNRLNSQGIGKSRGFAFCSFSQHAHALNALNHLNNNPNIFGDKKRPIVEFSLENRKALETKQNRLEKSMAQWKQKELDQKSQAAVTGGPEGKRQRKRQRKQKPWKDARPLDTMKQQDKVARSLHKGPLGLPSHSGPKQRHKQRPGQQGKEVGRRGMNRNNKFQNRQAQHAPQKSAKVKPPKMMHPNKKRKDFDNFDKLVASYKQKIMAGMKS